MTQPFSKTAADNGPRGLNLDIDGWLRGIGLAQYAEMFRANDIDGELLGRLTNDDLKDIGVGLVRPSQEAAGGDRRVGQCTYGDTPRRRRSCRRRSRLRLRRHQSPPLPKPPASAATSR